MKVQYLFSVLCERTMYFLAVGVLLSGLGLVGTPPCSAQTVITELYSFKGKPSSSGPDGVMLAQGRDGSLFGTTVVGGSSNDGTVFRLTTTGGFKLLYSFVDTDDDPTGGLTLGLDGNYYGTTYKGGSAKLGTLYKITPSGAYSQLGNFGGTNGAYPYVPPIQASDGNFYGTTSGSDGAATIYRYKPAGKFFTIFAPTAAEGQYIDTGLVQGSDGNLYGTADASSANACGTIFELTLNGTLLSNYVFPGTPGGCVPTGTLIQATDGNFYGVTTMGGSANLGSVFKLDQGGNVTTLYSFQAASGYNPVFAGLTEGTDGNLYGTTTAGGTSGFGTLFTITTAGTYTVLANFTSETQFPYGALLQDTNGLFYGTSSSGGQFDAGSVYSFDVGLAPFVTFVLPVGKVGLSAEILGQGFSGTTAITFNGVPATSFKVGSDTFLTAIVPGGAATGPVVVTTPTGILTSDKNFQTSRNRIATKAPQAAAACGAAFASLIRTQRIKCGRMVRQILVSHHLRRRPCDLLPQTGVVLTRVRKAQTVRVNSRTSNSWVALRQPISFG
jgi:uncharacterized repeat protein (TIGR03803 family)